jgi:hypothetical protein
MELVEAFDDDFKRIKVGHYQSINQSINHSDETVSAGNQCVAFVSAFSVLL